MAESELKLDLPCPRCGTSNIPTAQRCRQCFHNFGAAGADFRAADGPVTAPSGGLFDWAKPVVACDACGSSNPFNAEKCLACGVPLEPDHLGGQPLEDLEAEMGHPRLRKAVRGHRRGADEVNPSWLNFVWLLRLSAVLFLFWGVIDTSIWLTNSTKALAPTDPTGLRYTSFAIYELVRNACIAGGVWLLTLMNPRR